MYVKRNHHAWVFLFLSVLASLTACQPATPIPATPTPICTVAPPPTLIREPYLQSVIAVSIIVVWETDRASHGEVVYGETEEYGASVIDPTVGTRHAVTLTNLAPYTVYHYRVESGDAPLSADTTFRTAAGPDQTEFTFVAFGDTRTQHQTHQAVADRIVALEPDFVLHTGDLVAQGSVLSYWETFFEIERELMACIPLFPALGNHDRNHLHYFDLFYLPGNERWYAFDYGNARFLCLQVDGIADFGPQNEQYAWLKESLAANMQPWLFVYFHIPPYTSSREKPDLEHDVREALTPLFEQYGVDVVFAGHHHNYERNKVNGITYIVTGGGGAPLGVMEECEPTRAAFAVAYHVVLLEIDGDHLEATVFSDKGRVLVNQDTCVLPIYVGKAVPPGWRVARATSTEGKSLYSRLREHARNVQQVKNLEIGGFCCRFIILQQAEADLIVPVEAVLIRKYQPLWNSVVDGFGNHDPGKGRYNQARSEWDVLHPGRPWADKLAGEPPSLEETIKRVQAYLD